MRLLNLVFFYINGQDFKQNNVNGSCFSYCKYLKKLSIEMRPGQEELCEDVIRLK